MTVFASSDLGAQLKKANIDTLIITGLMHHACVARAARDAAPLSYNVNVIVASDASATRAITRVDGNSVTKDELQNSLPAEIEDTFGSVLTSSQIIVGYVVGYYAL